MVTIEVTKAAADAVRGRATLPFRDTSTPLPNGNRSILVQESTLARLLEVAHPAETLSDVIIRICATAGRALS